MSGSTLRDRFLDAYRRLGRGLLGDLALLFGVPHDRARAWADEEDGNPQVTLG